MESPGNALKVPRKSPESATEKPAEDADVGAVGYATNGSRGNTLRRRVDAQRTLAHICEQELSKN